MHQCSPYYIISVRRHSSTNGMTMVMAFNLHIPVVGALDDNDDEPVVLKGEEGLAGSG